MTKKNQGQEPTHADAAPPEGSEPPRTLAEAPADPDPALSLDQLSHDIVAAIRDAETAQQASVCNLPDGEMPTDLAKALERRVEVNLAQYDGGPVRRVGGTDPEVRRLEAPYSRRRAAGSNDHPQEGQS